MRPSALTAPSGPPPARCAKGRAASGPVVAPMWISYPESGDPLRAQVPPTGRTDFSPCITVSTSSRPSPGASPAGPSTPSGSRTRRPSIWYPPQSPMTRPPERACEMTSWSHPSDRRNARSPRVDFVPRSTTTSASRGSGEPGGTKAKSTPGSIRRGSTSSKLAIRERRGATMRIGSPAPVAPAGRPPPPGRRSRTTASSGGSRPAASSHGMTPRQGQPARRSMSRTPSSKRAGSPRNLLIAKLLTIAASAGSRTARVPTTEAMTPPRSMSARRHTGTCACRAKPMFAMSRSRRFVSAALPAPSTITSSNAPASRSKLSSTGGRSRSRRAR